MQNDENKIKKTSLCDSVSPHQTGHDIQQAEEDSSRPAVLADPGVRQDEGFSAHGTSAEFWWEPSALQL